MLNNSGHLSSVFISYRRKDAPGYVNGLMSELRNVYGSHQVFLDREDIAAGNDFADIINEAIGHCELLLAVIGPGWNEPGKASGIPRISETGDYVRLEICAAMQRGIPVIPVLIENAKIPEIHDLPAELTDFSTLHAIPLTHERWEDDIARLLAAIDNLTIEPKLARQYQNAQAKLESGQWQPALAEYEAITSVKPEYRDSRERLTSLRQLTAQLERLGPNTHGWRRSICRWPSLTMVMLGLLPNLFAALFNYLFNLEIIVHPMVKRKVAHAEEYFQLWAMYVNCSAFVAGTLLFLCCARPVSKKIRELVSGSLNTHDQLAALRLRCVLLGHYVALISVGFWIIAGPVYPLMIGALELRDYIYFIVSLTICGTFVSAYPFFLVTWVCTHVFYPPFLIAGTITAGDEPALARVDTLKWRYLILAGVLPMLILALGVLLGPSIGTRWSTVLLGIFGIVAVGGFLLILWLFRAIQNDIHVLKMAARAYEGKLNFLHPL